jgi:hypothetical protein|nr:protein of unknown function (DUF3154) [uncultured Mediterranean phage uvMED]BAR25642.1 protein of unknown function (DUF3154) [uncultured Mediterranean phage uvMED]
MLESLIAPVAGLLDKFIPDADERNRLAHEIATMSERHAHELAKGQIEINKVSAAHKSMFVAGWRPFVGWTCGVALAWHFVGQPLAVFVIAIAGAETPPLPVFEMESLLTVLLGMLGLGGLRTFEKTKNVAREK